MLPLREAIPFDDPMTYFHGIAHLPYAMLLDSRRAHPTLGRYSFIAFDPFLTLTSKDQTVRLNDRLVEGSPFDVLQSVMAQYQCDNLPDGPPFQGGMMGLFGYDLGQHIEQLPKPHQDDMQFSDLALGYFDVVVAFDVIDKQAWIFSNGLPEKTPLARKQRAQSRLNQCLTQLMQAKEKTLLASHATIAREDIQSPFSEVKYSESVSRFIEYILAGDIFEGTMSQRFQAPMPEMTPIQLYDRLRRFNPAPFSAFLNLKDEWILSASPERFLKLTEGAVETRPIKGTAPRSADPEEDRQLAEALSQSEKDWAENVMIVDLMRNDLSRVCLDHSVKVPQLCGLETFATVHHLVSVVQGQLAPGKNAIDLLRATFPGGSVTGAPKIRALEIIAELEPTARGPYCGSIGYLAANGDMDTSIVIRTFAIKSDKVTFQVGGAIVADSNPIREYQESLVKAAALMRTLTESV